MFNIKKIKKILSVAVFSYAFSMACSSLMFTPKSFFEEPKAPESLIKR